jgi:hypothetical protein
LNNTPSGPVGPWAHPGVYTIRLTVDGKVMEQPLTLELDPRVDLSPEALQQQYDFSMACNTSYHQAQTERERILALRSQILARLETVSTGPLSATLSALNQAAADLAGIGVPRQPDIVYSSVYTDPPGEATLVGLQTKFLYLLALIQGADAQPTSQVRAAVSNQQQRLNEVFSRWNQLKSNDLNTVNEQLQEAGLPALVVN